MSDLSEFLLARIAEDEAVARDVVDGNLFDMAEELPVGCWDERRVLAECEAKRRIVEEHRPTQDGLFCGCCWLSDLESWEPHPCPTLRAIALPYADHADYDDEWRP